MTKESYADLRTDFGHHVLRRRRTADLPSTTDACKTYEYPNPAATPIKTP